MTDRENLPFSVITYYLSVIPKKILQRAQPVAPA